MNVRTLDRAAVPAVLWNSALLFLLKEPAATADSEDICVPTTLPPSPEPEGRNIDGLSWAGLAVVAAMFIFGVIYWTGHTGDATAAPAPQTIGSSTASTTGSDTAIR